MQAVAQSFHQTLDRLRLIAGGREVGLKGKSAFHEISFFGDQVKSPVCQPRMVTTFWIVPRRECPLRICFADSTPPQGEFSMREN